MPLDPTQHPDWRIAEEAEARMKRIDRLAAEIGLLEDEVSARGRFVAKIDSARVLDRLADRPDGKYIDVTAITPTPLGEGKSTTTIGLIQGLGKRGKRVGGAIRQPSGGPTMNIKGSAAGGGLAQVIPLTQFSLGLTGDINAVTNAHNLAMVALTARLQHEFNSSDRFLQSRGLRRLDIDPRRVEIGWVMDFCAQSLRHIAIGLGGRKDGFMMESSFAISVSSEVMAILAMATGLPDFRERIGRMVVARNRKGEPVTTTDLGCAGAMTAWMLEALDPNLLQTIEGQPCFVHAGPFANIAVGQSSILADRLGLKLADYHVTESGFGADIGFEKFWNLKCRVGRLRPHCAVVVATIRALKCHGGGPPVPPGKPLDPEYDREHVAWVEAGCANLVRHVETVRKAGINPVVCLNAFHADTPAELAAVRRIAEAAGARVAVSYAWGRGGDGAVELADAVIDACGEPPAFEPLYPLEMPHRARIERIAREVYGASGVDFLPDAAEKLKALERDPRTASLGTCMVKTHLSLSHDPNLKGAPTGWELPVRDVLTYEGAGFVVPVAGSISLMPGTAASPAFMRVDVDLATRKVTGLF
jgi:formate--tetrahydrofolate ligase